MPRSSGEILLVDDSIDDVDLAVTVLSDYWPAARIVIANDGAQAGDYLYRRGQYSGRKTAQPVLVLLDIKMPKVGGLELVRILKSDDELKVIPVVMLTSSREERDVRDAHRLGANAYVVKPLAFPEFQEALKKLAAFWLTVHELAPAGA